MSNWTRRLAVCLAVAGLSAGCEGPDTPPVSTPGEPAPLTAVTLGLPYKPDVQFTPLYVAQELGHFAEQGLEVTFRYGDEAQFLRLLAAGDVDAAIASGEQVILARGESIPVKYVMTWYQRFAGVVFSLDPELDTPEALVGHRVGLPVLGGASYIGWLALLGSRSIDPATITTEVVGYTQVPAILGGRVDAAVGYGANEPVQLRAEGREVTVIDIADHFNLVSNGLVVSDDSIAERPEVVGGMATALLRGIRDTLADPDAAFAIALRYVPEAADPSVRQRQRAVLEASMPYWRPSGDDPGALGSIDPEAWRQSQAFLARMGLVDEMAPIEDLVDDRFVVAAAVEAPPSSAP